MAEARRIGLILGGGGVAGVWWELGVLAALQQHTGWNPASATVITGTSAGSMVGALTALGRDLDVLVDAEARGATIPDPPPASEARATTTSAVPQEFLDLLSPSGGPVIERAQKAGRLALDAEPPIDVTAYKEMMGSMV